jgi:hypothetical protein
LYCTALNEQYKPFKIQPKKAEGTNKHKTILSLYPNNSDSNKTEGKDLLFV